MSHHSDLPPELDSRLGALLTEFESVNGHLVELREAQQATTHRLAVGTERFDRLEAMLASHIADHASHRAKFEADLAALSTELQANTATTQVVRDTITTGRMVRRIIMWVCGILGAVGAGAYGVSQVVDAVSHRPPPGDIGPAP